MARSDAKVEVWLSQGNVSEFVVYADSTAITDLSGVTRAVICMGGVEADSDDDATLVWWTDTVTNKVLPNGETFTGDVLRARLGQTANLVAGVYVDGRISLYGSIQGVTYNTTTGPLVVSDSVEITVLAVCA